VLLLFAAASQVSGLARRMHFRGWVAWVAGAASGFLGGLVGNHGGLRSAALLGFDLSKQSFVATTTAVGLVVDGARMPFYLATQYRDMAAIWLWIALATIGVTMGTVIGSRVLERIPEVWFRRVLALVLALLGLAMVIRAINPRESGATARCRSSLSSPDWREMRRYRRPTPRCRATTNTRLRPPTNSQPESVPPRFNTGTVAPLFATVAFPVRQECDTRTTSKP
jgi:hypothetical protein